MVKFIGFIIIVASCAKIGFDLSQKYCKRTSNLKLLINVLERVKNEISFANCVITDALLKAVDGKSNTISNMVCSILKSVSERSVTLDNAFTHYISNNEELLLERNDIEEITRFFSAFGSGDSDDEIKNIDNTISNLKLLLNEAMDDEKRYVKLFRTSGVLAGFLIAIILA